MRLDRLSKGEWLMGISAILLFIVMFTHWFGVKATNTSNLLFAVQSVESGKNAWEALDYIPFVLLFTTIVTITVVALRLKSAVHRFAIPVNMVVACLGVVSVALIILRILDPPIFYVERTVTFEGTVQAPIFLALAAACGTAYGGYRAMQEKRLHFSAG